MSPQRISPLAVLTTVIAGLMLAPIASAQARSSGTRASIITSDQGGGARKPAIVRDHRGEPIRKPPRRPICAGWFC